MSLYEEALEAIEQRRPPGLAEILDVMEWCYYCGMPATTVDHTVPKSLLQDLADMPEVQAKVKRRRRLTVPACKECNSLVGSLSYETLAAKKAALKEKLYRRYEGVLNLPPWTEKEAMELGPHLRLHVIHGMRMQRLTRARLKW